MRTTVRLIVTATILLSFYFSAFSQQVAKTIPNSTAPERLIGFLEFRPSDYGSQKHPLIIFLHGIGERGNGTSQINSVANNAIPYYCSRGASMRFTVGGQTSSFVVLSPQLSTQYGYWPPYYVKEMVKYAKANLQIDPDRIYITGLSLGGGGTWRVLTDSENWDYTFDAGIAAAAPVCGTQEENDANFAATIGANHLPIWAFHCMDDGTVGVGATQHAEILANQIGLTPAAKFTYYQSGGHGGAWINAYDTGHITRTVNGGGSFTANPNMYEWFLSNKRNTGQTTPPPPANTVPVASAGNAQTITLPTSTVTLSGSGTGTNGATISSYAWVKTSGPSGGAISTANAASTSVTGLVQGSYVYTLTVTDNHALTSSAAVTITVNAAAVAANKTPSADAGPAQTITQPASSITLNGSASKDPDGTLVGYRWTQTVGPAGAVMATRDAVSTVVTGLTPGNYTFVLEVTDNGGLKAYSGVTVTVNSGTTTAPPPANNQLPEANAGANQTIILPTSNVTLNGSGSRDPDGAITAYRWTQTVGPSGPQMSSRDAVSTNVTGLAAGSYVFILEVTDNGGLKAYSAVTITVQSAPTTPSTPPVTGNLLGYIKMSTGPYQACADPSTGGRIAVYGSGIANGNTLYTNAALTTKYDGGWNWFSFTPVLGGPVTQAFAIYPNGGILLLRSCDNGGARIAAPATTAEQDIATLRSMKDSATASLAAVQGAKLKIFPNPVNTTATLQLYSAEDSMKTINLYDMKGVLKAKYNWQTTQGNNIYSLKNIASLADGTYVINVRDNSNGKTDGSLKFLKVQ